MSLFTDKVKKYNTRLMTDLKINEVQACGIWGNIGGETGGFKALQEAKPTVAGSRGGYGWLQWTGPRRRNYEAWCKASDLNPADDETNYKYLIQETLTTEQHSLIQLRKTSTIEAATETFMKQNLRPGIPNLQGRISWAKQAQNALVSDSKVTTQVTATAGAVVAGAAAASQLSPHHLLWAQDHWFLTTLAIATVLGLIVWGVHRYHEHQKMDILAPLPIKIAKKRGKKHG